jgi:hypothetical protein
MRAILGIAVISFSCAAPQLASAQSAGTGGEKIVCKRVDVETGSRVGSKRKCLTQAQWREEEVQSQRAMRQVDDVTSRRPVIVEPSRGGSQ